MYSNDNTSQIGYEPLLSTQDSSQITDLHGQVMQPQMVPQTQMMQPQMVPQTQMMQPQMVPQSQSMQQMVPQTQSMPQSQSMQPQMVPQSQMMQPQFMQVDSPLITPKTAESAVAVEIPTMTTGVLLRGKHATQVNSSRAETANYLEQLRMQKKSDQINCRIFPDEERILDKPMNIRRIRNIDPRTNEVISDKTLTALLEITKHRILFASGYIVPGVNEGNITAKRVNDLVTDVATLTCSHEQKFTAWNLPLRHVLNVELETSLGMEAQKTMWAKRRIWIAAITLFLMVAAFAIVMISSINNFTSDILIGGIAAFLFFAFLGGSLYYMCTSFNEAPTTVKSVEQKVLSISCISPTTFQPTITQIEFCYQTTSSNDLIEALNHISPKPENCPVICAGNVTQIQVGSNSLPTLA